MPPPPLERLLTLSQSSQVYSYVNDSVLFLFNTLPVYKNMDKIYISFNGGKDATVALYLAYMALYKRQQQLQLQSFSGNLKSENIEINQQIWKNMPKIKTIYFEEPDPFPEAVQFMEEIKTLFEIQEIKVKKDFKSSLKYLVEEHSLEAAIMGSRRADPYCEKLQLISPSDTHKGYPPFLRVNPIIDWTYEQVWMFLKDFNIPYCKLYEKGFTYLGNATNTHTNTHSIKSDGSYLPAWEISGQYEQGSRELIENFISEKDSSEKNIGSICLVFASNQDTQSLLQSLHENNQVYNEIVSYNIDSQQLCLDRCFAGFQSVLSQFPTPPQVDVYVSKKTSIQAEIKSHAASIHTIRRIIDL